MVPKSFQAFGAATGKIHKSRQYLHPKIFVRHLDSQYRRSYEEHYYLEHTNTINQHSVNLNLRDFRLRVTYVLDLKLGVDSHRRRWLLVAYPLDVHGQEVLL